MTFFCTNFCQFCTYQASTAPLNYYSVLSEIPTREFWRRIRIRGISRNFLDRNKEYSRVGIGARARAATHISTFARDRARHYRGRGRSKFENAHSKSIINEKKKPYFSRWKTRFKTIFSSLKLNIKRKKSEFRRPWRRLYCYRDRRPDSPPPLPPLFVPSRVHPARTGKRTPALGDEDETATDEPFARVHPSGGASLAAYT